MTVNHGRGVVTMVQTPMTAYLTRGRAQASQSVERIDDEGTVIGSSPRAPIRNKRGLPIKKSKKSKRQLREQKKRARKREKAKAKRSRCNSVNESTITPSSRSTPVPASNQDFDDAQVDPTSNDGSFLLTERSLTDMLASTSPVNAANLNSHEDRCDCTSKERIIMLESQLTASVIACEGEVLENKRLLNYIELLEAELESKTKTEKRQKSEIKRLVTENDNLRKSLSRFKGIRKYTGLTKSTNTDEEIYPQSVTSHPRAHEADREKFEAFHRDMVNVATSMVYAFEQYHKSDTNTRVPDQISDGQNVSNKQNSDNVSDLHDAAPTRRHNVSHSEAVAPSPHASVLRQTNGQNIPVVIGVSRKERIDSADKYSHDLNSGGHQTQPCPRQQGELADECVVIGSSLVSGLGAKLSAEGVKATSYTHRGALIPRIRDHIPGILPTNSNPKSVVLLCGGNDSERYHSSSVTKQYDELINDVRKRCPSARIILCKVPQRPGNERTVRNIKELNVFLDRKAKNDGTISTLEICPNISSFFKRDQLHLNSKGIKHAARELANHMRTNFRASVQMARR